jgi:hypothetical protein
VSRIVQKGRFNPTKGATVRRFVIALSATLVLAAAAHAGPAGLVTLNDFDDVGLGARWGLNSPLEKADFSLGATYFFDGGYVAADADLHFALGDPSMNHLYPLAGLQLATDFDFTDLNINLGAGYKLDVGSRPAFVEGKFVVGDADFFAATFGIQF